MTDSVSLSYRYPLIGKYGMDYMFEGQKEKKHKIEEHGTYLVTLAACSTTARRGALDWCGKFEKGAD